MKIREAAALSALLCVSSAGYARASTGNYEVYGAGTVSCGKWLADRTNGTWYDEADWVLGWLSAAGYYEVHGDLRQTDSDAVAAWLDNYCRDNPLKSLSDAAGHLVRALSKSKK